MSGIGKSAVVLCLSAVMAHVCAKAQSNDQADWQRRMLTEIIDLRADLTEYLVDAQQNRIGALTHELEQVRQEQKQLQDAERQQGEQIAQIERLLASRETDPQARPQIEALRTQLTGEGAAKLRSDQAALTQREAEVARRLERESQRGQKLQERARQLRAALAQR